jgi:hypothetical protein
MKEVNALRGLLNQGPRENDVFNYVLIDPVFLSSLEIYVVLVLSVLMGMLAYALILLRTVIPSIITMVK